MSLSRQSRTTPAGESDTPYPVDLDPLRQEDLSPELLAALEALSAALTETRSANPTPLAGALARLTEADVEHSLNSTPVQWRRNLLSTLRIPIDGTRVNRALCHDVLTRIQRDPEGPRAQQAARHLTHPVFRDLALAGFEYTGGVPEDASRPLTHRWSPALLRLTAWAQLGARVDSAHIWSWALTQPWMTDTGVPIEGVLSAAQLVVDLAPDTAAEKEEEEDRPDEADALPRVEAELVAEGPDSDQLAAALQSVKEALEAAAEPARRTAAAIAAEARPADEDLSALRSVAEVFDVAERGLRAHGAELAKADLAHVRKETDAALNQLSAASLRARLALVARLACRHVDAALAQDLTTAQERARAIREVSEWGSADLEDAEALDALLTMVELHADEHDPAEILALLPTAVKSRWLAYPAGNYTQLLFRPADHEPVEATARGAQSAAAESAPEALPTDTTSAAPLPRPSRGSAKEVTGDLGEGCPPDTAADESASTVRDTVPPLRAAEEPPVMNAPVVPTAQGEPVAADVQPEPDPVPPSAARAAPPAPPAAPPPPRPGARCLPSSQGSWTDGGDHAL